MYLEPCQTPKMETLVKIICSYKPFSIFAKRFILDVWQGSENAHILQYLTIRLLSALTISLSISLQMRWKRRTLKRF